jgi:hypothetical protein
MTEKGAKKKEIENTKGEEIIKKMMAFKWPHIAGACLHLSTADNEQAEG